MLRCCAGQSGSSKGLFACQFPARQIIPGHGEERSRSRADQRRTLGRMEGWKDGRMEGWKEGRMEGWKDGRMEGWKDGRMEGLEGWKVGRVDDKRRTCVPVSNRTSFNQGFDRRY